MGVLTSTQKNDIRWKSVGTIEPSVFSVYVCISVPFS